jgi:REP element-mobilizing transposase RayT
MRYDPQKHHRRSVRLPTFDYSEPGAYFVTICTYGRECILDSDAFRNLLRKAWSSIVGGSVGPDDGEFVVMPNHVHGVVWLDGKVSGARHQTISANRRCVLDEDCLGGANVVPDASPLRIFAGAAPGSLGAIVGVLKSLTARCINRARKTPGAPVWQRNYYEHIIRGERDLLRVLEYIRDNPARWHEDPDNPDNTPKYCIPHPR